jgi:protein SCO1
MKSRFLWVGIGILVGLAAVYAGWQFTQRSYRFQGSLIDPPVPAADFSLTDLTGSAFRLSDQRGKIVLLFFGYTYCPDVCPVTLSEFRKINQQLGNDAKNVRFIFITVDPERDTIEQLRRYVPNFDPSFIGLTGSRSDLEKVWKSYGVYASKQPVSNSSQSEDNYLVDHTARVYLIDQQGNWRLTYPFGMEAGQITDDLEFLLRQSAD